METNAIIVYYTIKRSFLFLDEWFFYYMLYRLYSKKYYSMMLPVLLYGLSCIYTSYKNIDKLENEICDIKQNIWLSDNNPIDILKQFKNIVIKYSNGEK